MDELFRTVFSICTALIVIEAISKLFPDGSGDLIRGIAVMTILLVLTKNILQTDFDLSFQNIAEDTYASDTISELTVENGILLLRERLYTLLNAAGIAVVGDEQGVLVMYRQSENGEITIDRVCLTLRYMTDRDRAFALIRSVMTEAVSVEINIV